MAHNEECVTVMENYPSSCSSSIIQSNSNYNNLWTINNSDLHASSNHLFSSSSWTTTTTNNNNINDHHQSSGDDEDENSVSTTTFTNLSNHDSSDLSDDVSLRNNNNSNNIFAEGGGGDGGGGNDHQLWNHLLLSIGCGEELQNPTLLTTPFNDALKNHHHHLIQTPASTTDESLTIKTSLLSSDMVVDDNVMINNWQIPNQDSTTITTTTLNDLVSPPPSLRESGGDDHHHNNMMMMNYMTNDHWGGSVLCNNNFSDHHHYYSSRINDSGWNNDEYNSRILASRRSRSFNNSGSTADYSNNMMKRPAPAPAPLMLDINLSKPFLKTLDLSSGCTRNYKQGVRNSLFPSRTSSSISKTTTQNRRNGRTQGKGISDHNHHHQGRKLLLPNSLDSLSKKPKQDSSSSSSLLSSTKGQMQQVPKVKLGDKITALQQIVSPFGKTDTASVLWESIGYIRFLQEQIQLLSTPYLRGCASKEIMERKKEIKDNKNGVFELRSRGLCLVPISCTPQLLSPPSDTNHNTVAVTGAAVSDYYTPVYRGSLYR